jgi:hypothetical protein
MTSAVRIIGFERNLSMSANNTELGHGDTVAAWTTVTALMLASVAVTAGVWFESSLAIIGGAVLAVAGLAAGFVLKKAGYGKGGSKTKSAH